MFNYWCLYFEARNANKSQSLECSNRHYATNDACERRTRLMGVSSLIHPRTDPSKLIRLPGCMLVRWWVRCVFAWFYSSVHGRFGSVLCDDWRRSLQPWLLARTYLGRVMCDRDSVSATVRSVRRIWFEIPTIQRDSAVTKGNRDNCVFMRFRSF